MRRVLIIAGETSGDMHGSALMRAMKDTGGFDFRGIGGPRMVAEGLDALRLVREMNFMGFLEVIRHLPFIRRTFRDIRRLVEEWKPELAILIDYPGFNLRLAPMLKNLGIPVMYYISPQLWAWHTSRVKTVRDHVDRMVVLFEFEMDFYARYGVEAEWVGHPLVDIVRPSMDRDRFRKALGVGAKGGPVIGLLPGSRPQELHRILPAMIGAASLVRETVPDTVIAIGCAPELDDEQYRRYGATDGVRLLRDMTYDLMAHADALAVTSGTATLECGISGTPMVIVYRTSPVTFAIGRMLVDVDNIGMINIVAGERIVPELWQRDVTPHDIARELLDILVDDDCAASMRDDLADAREKLGPSGASTRAAAIARAMLDDGP